MEKTRILSFETSHRVTEGELSKISASSQMNFCIETKVDPKTGERTIEFDNRG
jgi:hypothetical protein